MIDGLRWKYPDYRNWAQFTKRRNQSEFWNCYGYYTIADMERKYASFGYVPTLPMLIDTWSGYVGDGKKYIVVPVRGWHNLRDYGNGVVNYDSQA